MTGFGEWLSETQLTLKEIAFLKKEQNSPGSNWPNKSESKNDYIDKISNPKNIDKAEGLLAFYALWDIFVLETNQQKIRAQKIGFWDRFNISAPTFAVVAPGGILLLIFCIALSNTDLSKIDAARGIITLLFSVTTVIIAVIVTLSNFLSVSNADDADKRFQRGKDILTVLIGVFGALLGYYFGTDKNNYQPGQPPTQQGAQANLNANRPLPNPTPQANQQTGRDAPSADKPGVKEEPRPGNRPQ